MDKNDILINPPLYMGEYAMSWPSVCRMIRVSYRLVELGGEIDKFEMMTINYLFRQVNEEKKQFLLEKYGDKIDFQS